LQDVIDEVERFVAAAADVDLIDTVVSYLEED
jgi:hypothetical protein